MRAKARAIEQAYSKLEIGAVLGVTESRVCQIHTKGILQLRAKFIEPQRHRVR